MSLGLVHPHESEPSCQSLASVLAPAPSNSAIIAVPPRNLNACTTLVVINHVSRRQSFGTQCHSC